MEQDDWIAQEIHKHRKKAPLHKRLVFWWKDVRVAFYQFLNLDYSKTVGYPMTREKYKQWQKIGDIRYFECNGYEVCSCLDGLSPHLPKEGGWMFCCRDSGRGFKCGVVTRACLPEEQA